MKLTATYSDEEIDALCAAKTACDSPIDVCFACCSAGNEPCKPWCAIACATPREIDEDEP